MVSLRWLFLATVVVCASGCRNTSSAPEVPSEAEETARWAMMAARPGPFRDAWSVLDSRPYTRTARTEQRSEDGTLAAFAERQIAFAPAQGRRLTSLDSAGAFSYGHFKLFTSEVLPGRDPVDVGGLALRLSDEPLLPENTAAYTFRQRPDTLLSDLPANVFEATAHPVRGDGHNVRRLVFYVDPTTNALLGLRLARVDLGTFFREESEVEVFLSRVGKDLYAPTVTRVRSEAIMPFQPTLPVTTTARYALGTPLLTASR